MTPSGEISPDVIDAQVAKLRERVEAARKDLGKLEAELLWWESGRQFFGTGTNGGDPNRSSTSGVKPTLRKAILSVMSEKPRHTWLAETIIAELRGRNWLPGSKQPEHTVRSMLAQMNGRGELKRTGRGRYRLPKIEDE